MVRPRALSSLLLLFGLAASSPSTPAQEAPDEGGKEVTVDALRIERAIAGGVAWLRTQQFQTGCWDTEVRGTEPPADGPPGKAYVHPTGCTSLALYTLLKCGVPAKDKSVAKGFEWLRTGSSTLTKDRSMRTPNRTPSGTYEISMLILAIEARSGPVDRPPPQPRLELAFRPKERLRRVKKPDPEDLKWIKELTWQLRRRQSKGGAWRYGLEALPASPGADIERESDMSATSLTAMALLAAERFGAMQGGDCYHDLLRWVLAVQEPDGPHVARPQTPGAPAPAPGAKLQDQARGWGYSDGLAKGELPPSTGSMTASALATLATCSLLLQAWKSSYLTALERQEAETAWLDGLAWLDRNWTVKRNPGSDLYHFGFLLSLERLGDLMGMDRIAGRDWYQEGARELLAAQEPDGRWRKADTHEPADLLNTCFALLFLSRATPSLTTE